MTTPHRAALTPADLDAIDERIRAVVREELERSETKRKPRRRRSRSAHVAAALSAKIAPADEVAMMRAKRALGRL